MRRPHRGRGPWIAALAMSALLASAAHGQISGVSIVNTGDADATTDDLTNGVQRLSTRTISSTATTISARYAFVTAADSGSFTNSSITANNAYRVNFTVNVPGSYQLTVASNWNGGLTTVDDTTLATVAATADVGPLTGTHTGGTLASGTLSLTDPGIRTSGASGQTPFGGTLSAVATINGVSNGANVPHQLNFSWVSSCSSPGGSSLVGGDECAVRAGLASTLSGQTAGAYPGQGSRVIANDGHFVNVTIVSLCGNGVVDGAFGETCDQGVLNGTPSSCCSSSCTVKASGTQCRAPAGVCDAPETCNGVSDICPADALLPSSTVCRASSPGEVCDEVEFCTGSDVDCPADEVQPSGTECRGVAGICDVAEVCDGVSKFCPSDDFVPSGTECRGAAGICDVAEQCTGADADCPVDGFEPPTTLCRAASAGEVCDVAEFCTGSGAACPADAVEPATTVCRASTVGEVCDIEEFCDGTTKVCPPDAVEPATTVCRASSVGEVCDIAETCDGSSKVCPPDAVEPNTTVCRPAGGVCDVLESCDGSTKLCPSDAKSTALCRASSGACDVAETCDGVGDDCPSDGFATDGTDCDDSDFCNGTQTCTGGVCGGGTSPCGIGESCDESSDQCFAGQCPVNPGACRTAQKNKVLIKNKADNAKDKLVWKWTRGEATTQTELGDPLTTASYALCFYAGSTPTLIQSADVPPGGGLWSAIGTKGYKYTDSTASNDGITKIIVKGGAAGKSKALVKGKGINLPDFDGEMPFTTDLPLIVQLRNSSSGICWQGSFASPKKDLADQFNAKTP